LLGIIKSGVYMLVDTTHHAGPDVTVATVTIA
jgi:hypothetical protein